MKTLPLVISIIISFFLVFGFLPGYLKNNAGQKTVCFNNTCFYVELALTPEERSRGLMFRESLPKESGMLFVFESEGTYSFWMKNTLIPLDIIWMDSNGTVVFIKENAQPCGKECPLITPDSPAKFVLEVNGGTVKKIGLGRGDAFVIHI
ncbi:MAG: DUF192 domain-containing protein [Candidatus Aenigmatarchaeota archaeon]